MQRQHGQFLLSSFACRPFFLFVGSFVGFFPIACPDLDYVTFTLGVGSDLSPELRYTFADLGLTTAVTVTVAVVVGVLL